MLDHTSTPSKLEWLLVRNWAASGQTLFESRVEARSFLSCLARAVRAGQLEIHAYCLLTREFHMLVRAVGGILAIALRSACSRYEQWLQRTRGTVRQYFRGHCARTPIHDTETRKDAIRFIESWPLHASEAANPGLYPFATASMMRGLSPRPAWLSTHWIEGELGHRFGDPRFVDKYREHFIGASMLSGRRRIEARLSHETRGCSIADHLQHGDRHCVAAWLRTRAEEGLSVPSKWTICTPEAVDGVIQAVSGKGTRDSNSMRVAFLRILSGLSWDGIAQRMRHEEDWVLRMYQEHCARVLRGGEYMTLLVSIACAIPRVAENGGFPIPQSQLIPLDSLKLRDTQMHSEFIAQLPWKPLLRRRS